VQRSGGYGLLVEINHGNGYVTRYAHNQRLLVTVGDTVQKGQPISLIGSTGRSTGPHLHFEVRFRGAARIQRSTSSTTASALALAKSEHCRLWK